MYIVGWRLVDTPLLDLSPSWCSSIGRIYCTVGILAVLCLHLYQLLLVFFNWKDLLDCLELLMVHIVGLRQVLLHEFVVYLLVHNDMVHGASLRLVH